MGGQVTLAAVFSLALGGGTPVYLKILVELFWTRYSGAIIGIMSCAWALVVCLSAIFHIEPRVIGR